MSARLSPQREAETVAGADALMAKCRRRGQASLADVEWLKNDVHDLAAELAAVRAERDEVRTELGKYADHEPTAAEELAYLTRCLNDVHAVCDGAEEQSLRWENPLPVPEWVPVVREAADGVRPDNPGDRRRHIYIDGKGNAWLSLSHENGIRYIGRLAGSFNGDDTVDSVREATGSIREIGRCW
ncbi:hypothetical protein [Streptomyces sp. BA2]|uniref:hypothetical protein n=1 Tax=Streptomyces sp. BA2 TaxID=436595 RepID=UPI001321D651|nr:hypothetical protein [Streptomyces sp. BA2]MWA08839.1 hypothetical protein [Streptomyces sp. BA2]